MQTLIDLLAAGFVFLLFASIYLKRNTAAVRFWLIGWFFVLVHFASLTVKCTDPLAQQVQDSIVLGTLILCGLSFVLSRKEVHTDPAQQVTVACLLGLPWLSVVMVAVWASSWTKTVSLLGYIGALAMIFVALRWFRGSRKQLACLLLVVLGCAGWQIFALHHGGDAGTMISIVLTQCFGFNAVLLSFGRRRFSAATLTTGVGAVAWGLVWVAATLVSQLAPKVDVPAEIWNLPKYVVAAGMILTLLEEEILSAAQASERYRLLFAGNPHPMWMYNPETLAFLQVNEAAVSMYGFTHEQFRSMTLLDLLSEERNPQLIAKLREASPQQLSGPWLHRSRSGETIQVDIATQLVTQNDRPTMFALMHDVTERERLHGTLLHRAHHDVLTGLPNRALFEQKLHEALTLAEGSGERVAVFCIDLDRFKQINDSYGHAAGDLCLKEAAARIAARLGERGVLARSGGDEFMLLLGNMPEAESAESFASAILRDLRTPVQLENSDLELGGSVGFAVFPDDARTFDQLWRDADAAMYQAKRAGGGRWVRVSAEISNSANQASEIEQGLRRALKTGAFEVHYQPQMLMDGRLHSFEALFRCIDPVLRQLPVDRVIAIAEESGLIVPIGNWILEAVCRQCQMWRANGLPPVRVAVNVSPLQLTRFDFAREVARCLDRYRLRANALEFEVTESTMMPDRGGDAPHQIATLARLGIRFSVDDFGTGYSSLGRLHQLPVESLKIDRSFTQRIAEFNGTYPTVEAIISLAHSFGMKVVAEGVEDEEQMALLRGLGCDRVQGYLFGRPLAAVAATDFLTQSAPMAATHEIVA